MRPRARFDSLDLFHPAVAAWFGGVFGAVSRPQALGWPPIARGESTLILAPTGSGKTLAAFLWCLNQLMFGEQAEGPTPLADEPTPRRHGAPQRRGCRVLYVSPLKALAVDVERNLRVPLDGISRIADQRGDAHVVPSIAIRTGDTPPADRRRFSREAADILITTPESLYLLLTSNARDQLRTVETIIIDEIHALVPTKRGAHLALSLERLTARCHTRPQRIGLSATQRPLDEVARFLGGADARAPRDQGSHQRLTPAQADAAIEHEFAATREVVRYRPVTIVDAGGQKALRLTIEVPVEETARAQASKKPPGAKSPAPAASGSVASVNPSRGSVWSVIHPRLLELIRAHRSTLIFVNSRRLAERLAGAVNELAGETLVRSHHGSIAREQREEVETLLKAGNLRALVATSSLELGIDMGAIDLVIQIEAPPSVASGLQRIGRSGHTLDAVSEGVIFPKFRGDLVASAAVTRAMHEGSVEATRYPRNPLDIAAQQIVAMTAMDDWNIDDLFATLRGAAPFAQLSRAVFEGVLDMLAGRYPSDEFADLRPRITWHRAAGTLTAREGARHVAIINGGTIPDRGLYGVFLSAADSTRSARGRTTGVRVGELDEEMVFESRVGETFVLGASTWRIDDISHDRVLVSPAPGEPGKMPFWKGDRAGRPLELGLAIGRLVTDLLRIPAPAAIDRLIRDHDLDAQAAESLLQYLRDQLAAAGAVPDATTVLVERVRDELGDWRVCLLSPRGGPIHAPWAMAVAAKIRNTTAVDVEMLWGDDGFVVRFPNVDEPPDPSLLFPSAAEVQSLVVGELGATALFAGKFRENAARSLLLPKRRPGMRAPLWQQRKRASDLLAVASRFGSFPVLLETYRECLRDFFDLPSLVATLAAVEARTINVVTVDSQHPSPFSASLLFNYVATFLYDGDAPLPERRAQALSVDQDQLHELIGDAELRELLDEGSIDAVERQLQHLDTHYLAKSRDGVHDLLLSLGDLTRAEIRARALDDLTAATIEELVATERAVLIVLAGDQRYIAVEDAARYRDALGVALPPGLPQSLLDGADDALGNLAHRYARTHAPFPAAEFAARYGLTDRAAETLLARLVAEKRLIEGEFRPGGTGREWTDPNVLRMVRRRSLARLRQEIEPVDPEVLGRFITMWQGTIVRRRGPDAVLDVIEQLQGAPLPASIVETEILPARIEEYRPADLDALIAAGEVAWLGVEPIGDRDGRVALYLADQLPRLVPPAPAPELSERGSAILEYLRSHGASFFGLLHDATGGGYPGETVTALWELVWQGVATNDTFHALRAFGQRRTAKRQKRAADAQPPFRSRRLVPPSAEGRWSAVERQELETRASRPSSGKKRSDRLLHWATATSRQLLARHGVLTREATMSESIPGGFGTVYPVLKALEESGRIRRGYFVAGLGAAQFALPGAVESLRSLRDRVPDRAEVAVLAASDPANPYGATLAFPASGTHAGRGPTRSVGATVVLVDGALAAFLNRGDRQLLTWLPAAEPQLTRTRTAIAVALVDRVHSGADLPHGMLIEEIDGAPPAAHPLAPFLIKAGFVPGAMGFRPDRG